MRSGLPDPAGHCHVAVERTGSAVDEVMTQTSDSDTRITSLQTAKARVHQAMADDSQQVTAETE